MARSALSHFARDYISASRWSPYLTSSRAVYIGTAVSNLAHLVHGQFRIPNKLSYHFPFPAIRARLPWAPHQHLPLSEWLSRAAQDLGALPRKDIRDELVDAFFTHIHPGFPVIDEHEFRRQYDNPADPPPLILFQAILLVGSYVSQHREVAQHRSLFAAAVFRRAKTLFDLRYENDRAHLFQAALLFTWHSDGGDDVCGNAYYWAGVAARIAFSLGIHRDLSPKMSSLMPNQQRRLYRRLFWVLLQVDVLSSLNYGRPMAIDLDECDQAPLEADDLIDENDLPNPGSNLDFCYQNSQLCLIAVSVIQLFSPKSQRRHGKNVDSWKAERSVIDTRLTEWQLQLPSKLSTASMSQAPKFWGVQLQLHYNLVLLHLHRTPMGAVEFPVLPSSLCPISAEICIRSATGITKWLEMLHVRGCLQQCWFTSQTLILALALHTCGEAQMALEKNSPLLTIESLSRLENTLSVMQELSAHWSGVEAIQKIYREALAQLRKRATPRSDEIADNLEPPQQDRAASIGQGSGLELEPVADRQSDPVRLIDRDCPPATQPRPVMAWDLPWEVFDCTGPSYDDFSSMGEWLNLENALVSGNPGDPLGVSADQLQQPL